MRKWVFLALFSLAGGCSRNDESPVPSAPQPPGPAVEPTASSPFPCTFVDVSESSGIRFQHVTGGYGEKFLPETMGSGGAFLDYDGDGILDVFLVNSCFWPGHEPPGQPQPRCALFRGKGNCTFEDVTDATGAGISLYGMGCSVADYDGDGDDDLYVTGVGKNVLLRNDGGKFSDVTESARAGVGLWKDPDGNLKPDWSTPSAWADIDLDGDLDLLVGNYIEWTTATEIFTTIDGVTKAFTTPDRYHGLPCRLHLNQGDGTFVDATAAAGLEEYKGKTLGIGFWDFDGNGFLDMVLANDTRPNFLFMNRGGARFEETGLAAGIAYDETGRARAGMGIDIADYANDGVPGVVVANFSDEPISLYRWQKDGTFSSEAGRAGVALPTYNTLAFGIRFEDFDLDGNLDLFIVNGHIEPAVNMVFQNQTYLQSPQLFRGRGDGTFEDVSDGVGAGFRHPRVSRGLALGDMDGDGDLDALVTTRAGTPVLFRNDRSPGQHYHYLRLRLHGKGKNTKALGTTLRLTAGGVTQTRLARTGCSYLSESESIITFGLGKATRVEKLHVRWPTGSEKVVPVEGVDRTIDVWEAVP